MGDDRGKRLKVSMEDSSYVQGELVLAVKKLQEVQDELEEIDKDASDKVLEVAQKYNEICRPVYNRRNEIIESIPEFWLSAFLNHPVLCDLVSEEDQKILRYLDSINVEDHKDVISGYNIAFIFNQNPYFKDSKLTKTFTYLANGTIQITGTKIKWKENMGTDSGVHRQRKGNNFHLANSSFVRWLNEIGTESTVDSDFEDEVAVIIKEDLWPDPLKYFNNEADEEDSDEDKEDEEDYDEEEQNDGYEKEDEQVDERGDDEDYKEYEHDDGHEDKNEDD